MDFKRIELIFLYAFLGLNIFLFATMRQGSSSNTLPNELTTVTTVEARMRADRIKFERDFSREVQQGYYLSGESTTFNELDGFSTSVDLSGNYGEGTEAYQIDKSAGSPALYRFVRSQPGIYASADYTFIDKINTPNNQIILSQEFEGLPLSDETSALTLTVDDLTAVSQVVRSYTQTHVTELEPLREGQDIIPEADAVETLYMSNKIPSEGKIVATRLAYTRLFTVREKNVYIPAWFVWIENNKENMQVERVNGFTNSIISASVPELKK